MQERFILPFKSTSYPYGVVWFPAWQAVAWTASNPDICGTAEHCSTLGNCAKGCAGMEAGKVTDYNKICGLPPAQRTSTCQSDCKSASSNPQRVAGEHDNPQSARPQPRYSSQTIRSIEPLETNGAHHSFNIRSLTLRSSTAARP